MCGRKRPRDTKRHRRCAGRFGLKPEQSRVRPRQGPYPHYSRAEARRPRAPGRSRWARRTNSVRCAECASADSPTSVAADESAEQVEQVRVWVFLPPRS
jgi:hypothetical protein